MYRTVRWLAAPGILALLLSASALGQDVGFEAKGGVNRIKMELWALLQQYPPRLGEVIKLDHSLLTNQDYLAAYPEFKTFLQRHPEVIRDPDFFFGERETEIESLKQRLNQQNFYRGNERSTFRDLMEILVPFTIFFTVVGVLVWAVKIFQDHRRWLRVWRAQAEAHSKLMDRLSTSEDTLAYLQTPAGRRFFEGSPVVDPTPQRFSVPVGRILWSAQAGLLFLLGGVSLEFARAISSLNPDDLNAINIMSAMSIGLGVSFILGAVASYMISAKLGLLEQPARRPSSVVEPPASS